MPAAVGAVPHVLRLGAQDQWAGPDADRYVAHVPEHCCRIQGDAGGLFVGVEVRA